MKKMKKIQKNQKRGIQGFTLEKPNQRGYHLHETAQKHVFTKRNVTRNRGNWGQKKKEKSSKKRRKHTPNPGPHRSHSALQASYLFTSCLKLREASGEHWPFEVHWGRSPCVWYLDFLFGFLSMLLPLKRRFLIAGIEKILSLILCSPWRRTMCFSRA